MTDNEWILICIVVTFCAIVMILLHAYPIHDAINGTHALVVGVP